MPKYKTKKEALNALRLEPREIMCIHEDIEDMTLEELQLQAIRFCGDDPTKLPAISSFTRPTEKVLMAILKKNIWHIDLINEPTEEMQIYCVDKNPEAFSYCHRPTPKLNLLAVKKEPKNIAIIKKEDLTEEIVEIFLSSKLVLEHPHVKYIINENELSPRLRLIWDEIEV